MPPLNPSLKPSDAPEAARQGMRQIRVVTLDAGQILFRFASTKRHDGTPIPSDRWAASPWWMLEQDYRQINRVFEQGRLVHGEDSLSLGFIGRSAVAVQQSWSRVDVVIKAHVLSEINVFSGPGRTQYREMAPNGLFITLPGWPDVEQLFIPNISDRNGRTALFSRAILVQKQKTIQSQQLY